jgi:porphobilinogen synthase
LPYPLSRPRRLRLNAAIRELTQEHHISTHDLIYPVFVTEGANQQQEIASLPGIKRYSIDQLPKVADKMLRLGVKHMILFPVIDSSLKNETASYALDEDGLIPRALRYLKNRCPEIYISTDIALDPYTSHGQDGIMENNYVLNDATNQILTQQSLLYAACGVDMLAPSDMMDGRILKIREALENKGYHQIALMAYSAKYASCFYGPFRDAVNSKNNLAGGDKKSYQMNPANIAEAIREAELDLAEGADILMVKPGLPYLDVIRAIKEKTQAPLAAYHVSGEYAMLKLAAQANILNYDQAILETMLCFKRAGCDAIVSYAALEVARLLNA